MFSQKAWRGTLEHGCRDQTGMATSVFAKGFFLPETSFNERLTAFFYQKNGFMSGSMSSAASLFVVPVQLTVTTQMLLKKKRRKSLLKSKKFVGTTALPSLVKVEGKPLVA